MPNQQNFWLEEFSHILKNEGKEMAQHGLQTEVLLFQQDYQRGRIDKETLGRAEQDLRDVAKKLDLQYPGDPPPPQNPPQEGSSPAPEPSALQ